MSESERQNLEIFTMVKRVETDKEYLARIIDILLDSRVFSTSPSSIQCRNITKRMDGYCTNSCEFHDGKVCIINTIGKLAALTKERMK